MADSPHVPLALLWQHWANPAELQDPHRKHLEDCDQCVSTMGLCQIACSFEDLKRRIEEEGIDCF